MYIEVDAHTHTIASGHGYGTIREMAKEAASRGLRALGITEHAEGIPGTCARLYFNNLRVVPRQMYGIELMLGCEFNIIDFEGTIQGPLDIASRLDLRIAGIHSYCYQKGGTEKDHTRAVLAAIRHPAIDIIAHPDTAEFQLDYEQIVPAAKEHHVLLEINNNSLNPINKRPSAVENSLVMLALCKKLDLPILASSDAHDPSDIGRLDFAEDVFEKAHFPKELIINRSADAFRAFIAERRRLFEGNATK